MTELEFDVVIVGSGAGGGTVAAELAPLARSGKRIALLDWGGRFRARDHTRREVEMAARYYFAGGGFQTSSQDMTLAFARAVGGSTNVYTGVTFRPPEHVLHKWGVTGITATDLAPRLQKFERDNHVHLAPLQDINRNNQLFAEACRSLGWSVGQFGINTRDCAGLNTCNIGCARLAKQGTAVVQIPAAERAGVQVIPFCRVDRIGEGEVVGEIVPAEHGLDPAPFAPGPVHIRTKAIVLAAGAIHTPTILMRSYSNWAKRWPALGRWFTCHPALTLVAEHDTRVDGSQGHPKAYYSDHFAARDRFLLETCFYFPFTTAKNLAGFGNDVDDLMSRVDYMQQILVLILDKAQSHNRIAIDRAGRPVVHYRIDSTLIDAMVKSVRAAGRIFFAAGARRAHLPATGRFFTERDQAERLDEIVRHDRFKLGQVAISAAHLMGGCRMGDDPRTSVTDDRGRVRGLRHVYVADASLFPDSVEVNPYLTIMALADRVAEALRGEIVC